MTPEPTPTSATTAPTCDAVIDLAPWFVNGSLDHDERAAFEAHLASCSSCREEFDRTLAAFDLMTTHPSTLDLVELALEMDAGAIDQRTPLERTEVEAHVASCAVCQREMALIRAEDSVVDGDFSGRGVTPPTRVAERWQARLLAVAAGLVLALGLGTWISDTNDASQAEGPTATVARVDAPSHLPEAVTAEGRAADPATVTAASETPHVGVFFDGFESGDTGTWSHASLN